MDTLEPYAEKHRKAVIDIFNHYIEHTTWAYRSELLSYDQFDHFLQEGNLVCGFAVLGEDQNVIGFCHLKPFRDVSTFDQTAEVTYFFEPGSTGRGLGKVVLDRLTMEAKQRGKKHLLASVSGENQVSLKFHAAQGFVECGRFKAIGHKFQRDFDVVYLQKTL